MSGQARRLKRLETNSDTGNAGYWFDTAIRAINGDAESLASIEAMQASGGSPGYRGFQSMISEVVERAQARGLAMEAPALTETDYAEMGAA